MAFPTVAGTNSGIDSTARTAHTANLPASVAAGDLLIAIGAYSASNPVTPGGWTRIVLGTSTVKVAVYWKIAAGGESTVALDTTGSSRLAYTTYRITGHYAATSAPEANAVTTGTSTGPDAGSLNPAGWGTEDTLWLAATAYALAGAVSGYPASFSNGLTQNTTGVGIGSAERQNATAAEDPGAFTIGSSVAWEAVTIAVRPYPPLQTLTGAAIASEEAFGAGFVLGTQYLVGVGIASEEAFGAGVINTQFVTSAGGIASSEAFGAGAVVPAALPPRWLAGYEYVVEFFASGAGFGPGTKLGELWDIRNLGWSRYDRMPGRGFFTLYQSSPLLASLVTLNEPPTTHVRITRLSPTLDVEVFNGIVSDYNSTGDDVVVEVYDYIALLSLSRSGYRTLYPTKLLGSQIVSPEWVLAKGATSSRLSFVATGTIEDPLGSDGVTAIKTNAQFGTLDQMRLALFYDLTEMGRANTPNQVTYEITRTSPFTFTFLKNKGTLRGFPLVLNGTVSDYQHAPNWAAYRNDLATLGTTVGGGAAEVVKADATAAASYGLRQDVFSIATLAGVPGTTETDQQQAVAARALKNALEGKAGLWLDLVPAVLVPFDGWDICDTFPVEISNGIDSLTGNWRAVGVRGLVSEAGERLSLMIGKVLT